MVQNIEPDPSMIGGVPSAPFVLSPSPITLFQTRAKRLAFLAESSDLAPYLTFLSDLTRLQARLCVALPLPKLPEHARLMQARASNMPALDRHDIARDPALHETLIALGDAAVDLTMPEPARLALTALRAASDDDRLWLLSNVLSDAIPEDSIAPHLFAAAAVQVYMARMASQLNAADLVPVGTGACPSCGGKPASSSIMGQAGIENLRYATCGCCSTQWNEVRVKCLCCGSTKGLAYRSAETIEATVKAETCSACNSWVKLLNQSKNPTLEPIADDIGSLGLDFMMKETPYRKGGFNPFLVGY